MEFYLFSIVSAFIIPSIKSDCGTFGYEYIESFNINTNAAASVPWTTAELVCSTIIEGGIIANIDASNQLNELTYAVSFATKNNKNIFINNDNNYGYISHTDGLWHSLSNAEISTFQLSGVLCSSSIDPCIAYGDDNEENDNDNEYNDGAFLIHDFQILDLENGNKIYPSDRFKSTERSLDYLYVANDARRVWSSSMAMVDGITYAIDATDAPNQVTSETSENWKSEIKRAFNDWFDNPGCMNSYELDGYVSDVPIGRDDIPIAAPLTGVYEQTADITIEGFVDAGLNRNTLGQARLYGFTNEHDSSISQNGPFTDINNDGYADLAFCNIRMQGKYWFIPFSTDESTRYDIYTVAVHEIGHCLGLGHSGLIKIFMDDNGDIVRYIMAPPSIMQPLYDGKDDGLHGSDIGAICSIWSNWT